MTAKLKQIVSRRIHSARERQQLAKRVSDTTLLTSSVMDAPNFSQVGNNDLQQIFQLVDKNFFDGQVEQVLREKRFPLSFRLSKRMTSSGGITTMSMPTGSRRKKEFEIAISSTLLFQSFRDSRPLSVTGVKCENRLQALQRIMEHEIIHLVEMVLWHDSNCSAGRFRSIAQRMFGHRQSSHQLLTPTEVAEIDRGIGVGSKVTFRFSGRRLTGFVNRVTKRATVLVPDRRGEKYDDGKSYLKYYVPVSSLRLTGEPLACDSHPPAGRVRRVSGWGG